MVKSKVGWLCANCGHTESVKPSSVPLNPPTLIAPAEDAPKFTEVAPAAEPAIIEPPASAEPETVVESAPVAPVEATVTEVASTPVVPQTLTPVSPETHPHPKANSWVILVLILVIIVGALGYWLFFTTSSPLARQVVNTPLVSILVVGSDSPSPSASAGPNVSPSSSPAAPGDIVSRDSQRKTYLANYATAYKSSSYSGFYPLKPANIAYSVGDPTTNGAYIVQTSSTTGLGQIYYHAGGQCGGAGVTPGATGTRYLSLTLQLEAGNAPYCIDVK